jgi:BirA family biotin operon repressor/biotin-[acetyl-CoA-carboxylase] ligase
MRPLDIASVLRRLPGRRMSFFESLPSTMAEAARLAAGACPPGTAVVAEEQTAGQGRRGHTWHSEAGSGVYISIVLRPHLGMDSLPVLTMALGMAAAEAIARTADIPCDLRWPNDVMIGDLKAAGILIELLNSVAVAGIGINVNHAAFPEEIAAEATSLRLATGREQSREDLLVELLRAVDAYCRMLAIGGKDVIVGMFPRRSSYAEGKRVEVRQPGGTVVGTTAGLDPSGFLKVRQDDGGEILVLAGGVRALSA